ncbi:thioesterase domain-containing protein, partial [Geminicoccus harenae]
AALPAPGQPHSKTLHAFVVPEEAGAEGDLWAEATEAAAAAVTTTAVPVEPAVFDAATDRLARFTAGAAADALAKLGAFDLPAGPDGLPDIDQVMDRCRIVPGYRRWLARTMALIRRHGRDAAADDPLRDFAAFDRFGFGAADLKLLQRLTAELPDILTGRRHAGDIYLDAGTPEVYAKLFQVPYQVLGRTIRKLAERQPLAILEVGAGLGTTLAGLHDQLPLDRITYHFTDVSQHFIHMAERRLGDQPWLHLSRLDLMAPVEAAAEQYDVVIASSVVHAVPEITTALASIRQRLRPGGVLVMIEETRFLPWYDLSMGLQSGFDSFTDGDLRQDHPLLGRDAWRSVLAKAGFARVDIPSVRGSIGERLGLDVLLASTPAVVTGAVEGSGGLSATLRRFLAERLPDYMVPRFFHRLQHLPLSSNGKVDRAALGRTVAAEATAIAVQEQPASPAERRIAELVGEALGTAAPSPTQSFFDLGADSLKLVMVQRRLRETTGRSLDMSALFADPTVRGIAAALELPAEAGPAEPLVMFGDSAGRPILFTVPGVVALPYYLRTLAQHLGPDLALAGLQLPGFFGGEAPLDRIEAQAAYLVAAMRVRQPRGPYLLLGHSYGGHVAYEAARQLRFQGEEVAFLGMLDTVVTESSLDDFQNDQVAQGSIVRALYALYGDRLPEPLDQLRKLPPDEQMARTMHALGESGLVDLGVALDGLLTVFKANFRAMVAYQPRGYDGPLTLFRTEGGFPEEYRNYESGRALEDPALGWTPFVQGKVTVELVPGDHLGMLDAERLPHLAAMLRSHVLARPGVEGLKEAAEPV